MKVIINIFFVMVFSWTHAQEPVQWSSSINKISEAQYELIFTAKIEKDWHLYSQYNPEGASLPIEFDSDQLGKDFSLVGKAKESQTHKEYSKTWEKEEVFFVDQAVLAQRIEVNNSQLKSITITMYGQVCKEICIQMEQDFVFDLTKVTDQLDEKKSCTKKSN